MKRVRAIELSRDADADFNVELYDAVLMPEDADDRNAPGFHTVNDLEMVLACHNPAETTTGDYHA